MLSLEQKKSVEALIREVGDEYIRPFYKGEKESSVSYKASQDDPVTIVDQGAEELLKKGLAQILPESLLLGEETYAQDPSVLDYLKQSEKPVWIIDPIDGTDNFIEKKSGFGSMICLYFQGDLIGSWFYEVTSQCLTSYCKLDDVQENGRPLDLRHDSGPPYKGLIGKKLYRFPSVQDLNKKQQNIIIEPALEPSIVAYREVLLGNLDFIIFKVTYPWDHLPGIALLSSIGAQFCRWNGEPFQYSDVKEGLVVARNASVMEEVLETVIKPLQSDQAVTDMKSF